MNKKISDWLINQAQVAKVAWSIVVIVAGLLGYTAKVTPTNINNLEGRLISIQTTLEKDKNAEPQITAELIQINTKLAELKTKLIEPKRPEPVWPKIPN